MFTAAQARKVANDTNRLDEICRLIQEAAAEGRYSIYLSCADWDNYGAVLSDVGYTVQPATEQRTLSVKLSW